MMLMVDLKGFFTTDRANGFVQPVDIGPFHAGPTIWTPEFAFMDDFIAI